MEKIDNATEVLLVAWEKVKKMTLPSYSNDAISIPISRHYRIEEL